MNILKLSALLLGMALFTGIGATTLNAEGMKCGAGKCGSAMKAPMVCNSQENCKCESCDCENDKKACTCQKCECDGKKAPLKAMKCGSGMMATEQGKIQTH